MADTRTAMLRLSALVGERTLFENEAYRKLCRGTIPEIWDDFLHERRV